MKEQFLSYISIIALAAYHIPLAFVILKKLWKDTPILIFALYWSIGGLTNLMGNLWFISRDLYLDISVVHNILDVPFVLFIFFLNTNVPRIRSMAKVLIPLYLFVEIIIGFVSGFNVDSFNYMDGLGVVLLISVAMMEVIEYFKKMHHSDREKATIFLFFAVLFEYSSYLFVYIAAKYWKSNSDDSSQSISDELIIYYGSTLLGIIIACFGFMSGNLRKKTMKTAGPRRHEVLISIID